MLSCAHAFLKEKPLFALFTITEEPKSHVRKRGHNTCDQLSYKCHIEIKLFDGLQVKIISSLFIALLLLSHSDPGTQIQLDVVSEI